MPTVITGTDGINQVQAGSIQSDDLAAGVGGKVLQVVGFVTNTQVQITAQNTFIDTTLEASITPSNSSNKILVITNQKGNHLGDVSTADTRLLANGTEIYLTRQQAFRGLGSTDHRAIEYSLVFLHSPATTSQVTYKTQVKMTDTNRIDIQKNGKDGSIILMEIAG